MPTDTQHTNDTNRTDPELNRRQIIKTVGVIAGAAAVGTGSIPSGEFSPMQRAQAQSEFIATPGIGIVGKVLGFFSGDSDEAQKAALQESAFGLAKKTNSQIESSITLNQNIDLMINEWAFTEGKIAAFEAIEAGKSESEIKTAAKDRADEEIAIMEENVINATNAAIVTVRNLLKQASETDGVSISDIIGLRRSSTTIDDISSYSTATKTDVTLSDGRKIQQENVKIENQSGQTYHFHAVVDKENSSDDMIVGKHFAWPAAIGPDGDDTPFWPNENIDDGPTTVADVWDQIQTTRNNVHSNLDTWVANSIEAIQDGELESGDLLGPDELVRTITDDYPEARAIADLRALNIAADWDHPVTVELENDPVKLFGATVGVSDPSVKSDINQGETIDPSSYNASFYLNYNVLEAQADWSNNYDSDKEIDGGILHLTDLPGPDIKQWLGESLEIYVLTSYDETVAFSPSETTKTTDGNGNTVYEIDLSDNLNEAIAEVVEMKVYAPESVGTNYVNGVPDQPFTITEIDGTASLSLERERDLQTDDNYLTKEEWQQLREQRNRTEEEIEEETGVIGGGGGLFGGGLPTLPGLGVIESAVVVILSIVGLNAASS